ncbi:hypothetical protein MC7420_5941 [Coleofasciculus chthonoplastes PCC 7420]|uniref:Uncharacterized protein n=1 Tax=Coleofasciculus chthonoplastes PCC 7420 TaxID=118168 RepID=B4VW65_9CYAN|nr:hypothetical protein MC7420_5941 [Coleofasciculus chthonoplastes PCC 7420]
MPSFDVATSCYYSDVPSANGILTWVMNQLNDKTRGDREIHPPESPHPTQHPEID